MAQVHQNVNLMNENAHRQNELKSKQVILLLWHLLCAVVVALVVVLTICSLLLWQSEIATVQGEASRMALKRDALVKKVIRTSSGLNI